MQGFSLWFDPDGGKERAFGIGFPLGREEMPDRSMIEDMRSGMDQQRIQAFLKDSLGELEILGPGKDVKKRISVEEAKGIEVDLQASGGRLVYEIKVPLLHDEEHPYAVGAREGDLIGIGMETPEIDMAAMREKMGGRSPGGMGGGGGMRGAGGMGMGGGRRPQMPTRLKIWMTLRLASDKVTASDLSF